MLAPDQRVDDGDVGEDRLGLRQQRGELVRIELGCGFLHEIVVAGCRLPDALPVHDEPIVGERVEEAHVLGQGRRPSGAGEHAEGVEVGQPFGPLRPEEVAVELRRRLESGGAELLDDGVPDGDGLVARTGYVHGLGRLRVEVSSQLAPELTEEASGERRVVVLRPGIGAGHPSDSEEARDRQSATGVGDLLTVDRRQHRPAIVEVLVERAGIDGQPAVAQLEGHHLDERVPSVDHLETLLGRVTQVGPVEVADETADHRIDGSRREERRHGRAVHGAGREGQHLDAVEVGEWLPGGRVGLPVGGVALQHDAAGLLLGIGRGLGGDEAEWGSGEPQAVVPVVPEGRRIDGVGRQHPGEEALVRRMRCGEPQREGLAVGYDRARLDELVDPANVAVDSALRIGRDDQLVGEGEVGGRDRGAVLPHRRLFHLIGHRDPTVGIDHDTAVGGTRDLLDQPWHQLPGVPIEPERPGHDEPGDVPGARVLAERVQ